MEMQKMLGSGPFTFNADRYHAVMMKYLLKRFPNEEANFYITQRKCLFAPVLGHSRLRQSLIDSQIDVPHARFLKEDRADLRPVADALLEKGSFLGRIRLVPEGTIMFAGEPIGDIAGPLYNIQYHEVKFQHAFDLPMTVASRMMRMRFAAGNDTFLSVFSLRRDGDAQRSIEVSKAAYIGQADDTSDLEAAFVLGIPSVGTMAHYLVEAHIWSQINQEIDPATGKPKHFEQIAFERWLDANPKGTVLLIDTVDWKMGIVHAIAAALSSPTRREAFKGIRIDSGNLIDEAKYCRVLLEANGFKVCGANQHDGVGIILTGDLDAEEIGKIKRALNFPIQGFGIGTRLAAEVDNVAGIIFKMSVMENLPVMKLSGTPGKETLPGRLQVWRCVDKDGNYVKDIIALEKELKPKGAEFVDAIPLLEQFDVAFYQNQSPQKLRELVGEQLRHFKVQLDKYPVELSIELLMLKEATINRIKKDENVYAGIKGIDKAEQVLVPQI